MKRLISAITLMALAVVPTVSLAEGLNATGIIKNVATQITSHAQAQPQDDLQLVAVNAEHVHDETCVDPNCTENLVEETVTEEVTNPATGKKEIVTKKVIKNKVTGTYAQQGTAKQTTATTAKPAQQTQAPQTQKPAHQTQKPATQAPATTKAPATTAKPATTKAPTTAKPAHTHSWKIMREPIYETITYVPESSKTYEYDVVNGKKSKPASGHRQAHLLRRQSRQALSARNSALAVQPSLSKFYERTKWYALFLL